MLYLKNLFLHIHPYGGDWRFLICIYSNELIISRVNFLSQSPAGAIKACKLHYFTPLAFRTDWPRTNLNLHLGIFWESAMDGGKTCQGACKNLILYRQSQLWLCSVF